MLLARATWIFVSNLVWRLTSLGAAGRVLIRALGSGDENIRTISGMFLVRGGSKAAPLLREAIEKRETLPVVLPIIASIGDRQFEPVLRRLAHDADANVAKAARDALRLIGSSRTPA
jgi:HEAT repeat protein